MVAGQSPTVIDAMICSPPGSPVDLDRTALLQTHLRSIPNAIVETRRESPELYRGREAVSRDAVDAMFS